MPPSPSTSPPKIFGIAAATSNNNNTTSLRNNNNTSVPDHVANPHKYTRYQFDEPVLVGGGISQLTSAEEQQQVVELQHSVEEGVEEERWQGAVGGGIEFRRKSGTGGGGTTRVSSSEQQQRPPVKATFEDDFDQDQELYDASPRDTSAAPVSKRQYRKATTVVGTINNDDDAMLE